MIVGFIVAVVLILLIAAAAVVARRNQGNAGTHQTRSCPARSRSGVYPPLVNDATVSLLPSRQRRHGRPGKGQARLR